MKKVEGFPESEEPLSRGKEWFGVRNGWLPSVPGSLAGEESSIECFHFNPSSSGFLTKRLQYGAAGHPYYLDEVFPFYIETRTNSGKKYSKIFFSADLNRMNLSESE
jgi:hypothetical protein